jgi:hypothetical protein
MEIPEAFLCVRGDGQTSVSAFGAATSFEKEAKTGVASPFQTAIVMGNPITQKCPGAVLIADRHRKRNSLYSNASILNFNDRKGGNANATR